MTGRKKIKLFTFLNMLRSNLFVRRYIEYIMFFPFQLRVCPKLDTELPFARNPPHNGALPESFSQYVLQLKQAGEPVWANWFSLRFAE